MMMYPALEEMYYDEGEDYYEDGPSSKAAHTYRWVRPGYIPPGETPNNKSALEQRKDEIERLKNEIAEKEKRLKLTRLQNEIKELTARVDEKERLVRKRQVRTDQAEIDEKIAKKHAQDRKTRIQSTFKQVFNISSKDSISSTERVPSASLEDIKRIRNANSDYECFQLSPPTTLTLIKKKYKELARMLHPDKCNLEGAKDAFQKLKIAYDRLSQIHEEISGP